MKQTTIKEMLIGEFFKRNEKTQKVWTRGVYDKTDKKFECSDFEDVNHFMYFKGSTKVWVGFEF